MRFFNRYAPLHASDDIRTRQPSNHLAAPGGPDTSAALLRRHECRSTGRFVPGHKLLVGLISILSSTSVAMAGPLPNLHKRHTAHAGECRDSRQTSVFRTAANDRGQAGMVDLHL